MTTLNIFNVVGEQVGTVETIFNIEPNKSVMHEVLTAELAAARQGSASTLKKGEVRGGGRKPFKQKGTGRARQGSIRAPHMRGGGVTFGPKPRDFDKKVNKKVRALAIKSALSAKVLNSEMLVLDNTLDVIKTQNMVNFMDKIESKKVLFPKNPGPSHYRLPGKDKEKYSGQKSDYLLIYIIFCKLSTTLVLEEE